MVVATTCFFTKAFDSAVITANRVGPAEEFGVSEEVSLLAGHYDVRYRFRYRSVPWPLLLFRSFWDVGSSRYVTILFVDDDSIAQSSSNGMKCSSLDAVRRLRHQVHVHVCSYQVVIATWNQLNYTCSGICFNSLISINRQVI